jgi:hypothetical protein
MMKRGIFIVLAAISLVACDLGDEPNTEYELGPIEGVTMAASYRVDSTSQIMVTCIRPTDCHILNGFYYDVHGFTRTVAMQFAVVGDENCQPEEPPYPYDVPLNFRPQQPGTYHFKFWTGVDDEGNDTFIEADAFVPLN